MNSAFLRLRFFLFIGGFLVIPHQSLPAAVVWPGDKWAEASPGDLGMEGAELSKAREYAETGGGSGVVVRHGRVVLAWGDRDKLYDLKSTTKSIGVTALGLAIGDGRLALEDRAMDRHPRFGVPPESNAATGWLPKITLRHLATQTAGFEKRGGYEELLFEPGTKWHYSDGGPNWLAECVTLAYGRDLQELMFERVFGPIGIARKDLRWRRNQYRPAEIQGVARREFGAGVHADVEAMARIGYLYLREGKWKDQQLIPSEFVALARNTDPRVVGVPETHSDKHGNASDHYGLLWWNNRDLTLENVPRDAYWSWGLYDSLIVVIPSLDLVAARAGRSWKRDRAGHYDVLAPFFEPIVASVKDGGGQQEASANGASSGAPCPPSPLIRGVEWESLDAIVRMAKGSDNWPLTWAEDDALYGAYGDGFGFEPRVPDKLSLGLVRVTGGPDSFSGVNIRSPTAEQKGNGRRGRKASGMLMVDGVLYMLVRNADNSQLAWSGDRGATWAWSDWKFETSFGCPTFLNFGKNYSGARDEFVYVFSQDSGSAYLRADRMVLARVHKTRIKQRNAWEFFVRVDDAGKPVWTSDIGEQGAVFSNPGGCYRSGITWNAGLKRYLWCQTGAGEDTRFKGGLGIYDAPEPWGPWTTVFYTGEWDTGPGESSSLPTPWMSPDGTTLHLVFSGNDCFSVRRVRLLLRE